MIRISTRKLGKKYNREWIFRGINEVFEEGHHYAITGPNGSGKSTLLHTLCGILPPTEGKVDYLKDKENIPPEGYYQYISFVAPYMELVEEFSLRELLSFHFGFKGKSNGLGIEDMIEKMYLDKAKEKPVRHFSSGMKQRLKLGLAFYANTPIIFLDEPTSNMDTKGIDWYVEHMSMLSSEKLIITASNLAHEYEMSDKIIKISDFVK